MENFSSSEQHLLDLDEDRAVVVTPAVETTSNDENASVGGLVNGSSLQPGSSYNDGAYTSNNSDNTIVAGSIGSAGQSRSSSAASTAEAQEQQQQQQQQQQRNDLESELQKVQSFIKSSPHRSEESQQSQSRPQRQRSSHRSRSPRSDLLPRLAGGGPRYIELNSEQHQQDDFAESSSSTSSSEHETNRRSPKTHNSNNATKKSRASVYPTNRVSTVSRDAFGPKVQGGTSQDNSLSGSQATIFPGGWDEDGTGVDYDKSAGTAADFPGLRHAQAAGPGGADAAKGDDTYPHDFEWDTLFFRDGRRRIDMVLVYRDESEGVMTELEARNREQRRVFEQNLLKEGLQLELESKETSFDGKTYFLKLHIPWKVKVQYAEVMNLKLPCKRFITISVKAWDEENAKNKSKKGWRRAWARGIEWFRSFHLWDTSRYPDEPSFYASTDTGDREERFVVKDRDTAFTPAQRSLIVMQILLRARYDEVHEKSGIRRLLADGTYVDCFPLHEGAYNKPASSGQILDRYLLYLIWARPGQWYKKQPLWLIKRYFGEKVGLYFAWLGFYTRALYPPAIVGLLCFFYGLGSMDGADNVPSKEICDTKLAGNITICPLCDKACPYTKLGDSCLFARLTYLFDNPSTVFFAIFMSFWATTFLEMWKRRQQVLAWEWDMTKGEVDEEPRPEFEASVKTFRINPVTREREPYLPVWSRTMRYVATGSIVFFMICVVLGAVLGTIIYRISLVAVFHGGGYFLKRHAKIFTSLTAAFINLIIIMILTRIYQKLARWMVNLENPRTQTEYESSFTFKIFFFEFVNFYSSLIYIAFFKGRFYVHPGDRDSRASEFYRIRTDVCDASGCLSEVCIQLAIIMIGKQVFNNFVEILSPKMWNWWRKRSHKAATRDQSRPYTSWETDYQLQDPGRLALFDEYLEMIIQYGFVTLFVAAFPLAPLFALLNNIAEIRLDAYKMTKEARRPLAERVEDIGAWYGILKGITYAAVVSNAFVIAYTSDFIPRTVYSYVYSPSEDLVGYIDSSLSEFNTSHYTSDMRNEEDMRNQPPTCQYRGYRNGPDHPHEPYGLSPQYWHVFAARLAFVVVFEHVVFALTGCMSYIIPATPRSLATQLSRERLLAQEAKYEKGVKGRESEDEVMSVLREVSLNGLGRGGGTGGGGGAGGAVAGGRGSWMRRFSKLSDGLDAHIDVPAAVSVPQQVVPRHGSQHSNKPASDGSTVWEVH